jgi:hypothetical protein
MVAGLEVQYRWDHSCQELMKADLQQYEAPAILVGTVDKDISGTISTILFFPRRKFSVWEEAFQ